MVAGSNSRILPWSAIPRYLRIIRVLAYLSWVVVSVSAIYAGVIYTQGLYQPTYKTGEFTRAHDIKGQVHYQTEAQSIDYTIARTVMLFSFPAGMVIFIIHNILDWRKRKKITS